MNKTASILIIVSITCLMVACTEKSDQATPEPKPVLLKGNDTVLVTVGGSPITKYDLDQTILTTLSFKAAEKLDKAGRKKVLESLVTSRAIAQAQEKVLAPKESAALEKKVGSYREQLLVKQYLAKNTQLEPVSREMVMEYYESHPERFGAKTIRTYEVIFTGKDFDTGKREKLMTVLNTHGTKKDWKTWTEELKRKGFSIFFRKGQVDEKALHPDLKNLIRPLKKGETSRLSFIKGSAYLVRITDERMIPPRPLQEVRSRIRKSLAPIQLKKAVKQASTDILKEVDVVYQ